jgi:hypothetical protein
MPLRTCVATGLVVLLLCGAAAWHTHLDPSPPATPPTARATSALADHFLVFKDPPDHLPQAEYVRIRNILQLYGPALNGLTGTQRVGTPGGSLWLFKTSRLICLAHERGAACAMESAAQEVGVFLSVFRPPDAAHPSMHDFLVCGLVPNGVRHVRATVGERQAQVVVRSNVFCMAANQRITLQRLVRR